MCREGKIKIWVQAFGGPHAKNGVKNVQNSAGFWTTLNFDREYPWNGSRYKKNKKTHGQTTYNPFRAE